MAWTLYRVVWQLESPLHSGFAKLGNIQRTRLYVTGRTLWGALTSRMTRDLGRSDYDKVGLKINENLAISYAYLCFSKDGLRPLTPQFTERGLGYRQDDISLTERDAERLCLTSYASTAKDYENKTALEGALHEVEFISPRVLGNDIRLNISAGQPIYLTAMIAEKEDYADVPEVKYWKDCLRRLEIGGERTYGFGRLQLESDPKEPVADHSKAWFGGDFDPNLDRPVIKFRNEAVLVSHASPDCPVKLGKIDPFVYRTTNASSRFGELNDYAGVFWLPGSVVKVEDKKIAACQVGDFGLFKNCQVVDSES